MEKLKILIQQHRQWQPLDQYLIRIEGVLDTDFDTAILNIRALLESIAKEICEHNNISLKKNASINSQLKQAFGALGFSGSNNITQISSAITTIGQNLGNIRNDESNAAHGRTMEELRESKNRIDALTKDFLVDSAVIISCFLIQAFERNLPLLIERKQTQLEYTACEEFNNYWDDAFGSLEMGELSFQASEILFSMDYQAYETEYKLFMVENE